MMERSIRWIIASTQQICNGGATSGGPQKWGDYWRRRATTAANSAYFLDQLEASRGTLAID